MAYLHGLEACVTVYWALGHKDTETENLEAFELTSDKLKFASKSMHKLT